jgi:hypothetical protein
MRHNPPTTRPPTTVADPAGVSLVGDADQPRTQLPSDAEQQPRPPTPEENSIQVDPGSEHSETSEVEEELAGEPEDLGLLGLISIPVVSMSYKHLSLPKRRRRR